MGRQAVSSPELVPYIIAQVAGAIVASFVLYLIASGKSGFDLVASGFAANGYGEHSPGGYSLFAALVAEVVLTYIFLLVILVPPTPGPRQALPVWPSAWPSP